MEDRDGRRDPLDRHDGRAVLPGGGARFRPAADRLGVGRRIARALGAIPAGRVTVIAATLAIAGALSASAAGDGTPGGDSERAQGSLREQAGATPNPS